MPLIMLKTTLFQVIGTGVAVSLLGQTPTIPERATAADGQPVSLRVHSDTRPLPLEELSSASLIVRGKLTRPESYLSKDSRHIWTTYQLLPSQVLVARNADHSVPDASGSYTVTLYGGDVVSSGTKVEVLDSSRREWTPGADLLLFLVSAEDVGAKGFRPMGGASGMFEIAEGQKLKSLRSQMDDPQEINGLPFTSVVSMVARAAKR